MKKRSILGLMLASAGIAAAATCLLPGLMKGDKKCCPEGCCPPETGAKKKSHPSKSKRKQKKA